MKIVYDPVGGPRQEWKFEAGQLTIAEAIYAEEFLDMPTGEIIQAMIGGSVRCMRIYLLLMMKREKPETQLSDLDDIQISKVGFEDDEPEPEAEESGKETAGGEDSREDVPAA